MEQWKDVVGYEGLYEVSSYGKVRRKNYLNGWKAGHVLKPGVTKAGYHSVSLTDHKGNLRQILVHRLVATAFIGPCPPKHNCNHKDGVKNNNRIENLEWTTFSQNMLHRHHTLGIKINQGEKHGNAKLTDNQVEEIRSLHATYNYTQRKLANMYNVAQSTISRIIHHKRRR